MRHLQQMLTVDRDPNRRKPGLLRVTSWSERYLQRVRSGGQVWIQRRQNSDELGLLPFPVRAGNIMSIGVGHYVLEPGRCEAAPDVRPRLTVSFGCFDIAR